MSDLYMKITFMDSEKDLYDYVKKHASISGFVKDIIREKMESENKSVQQNRPKFIE